LRPFRSGVSLSRAPDLVNDFSRLTPRASEALSASDFWPAAGPAGVGSCGTVSAVAFDDFLVWWNSWDRCYDFKNIFAGKIGEIIGVFYSKQS
jgi:hypothetical protein